MRSLNWAVRRCRDEILVCFQAPHSYSDNRTGGVAVGLEPGGSGWREPCSEGSVCGYGIDRDSGFRRGTKGAKAFLEVGHRLSYMVSHYRIPAGKAGCRSAAVDPHIQSVRLAKDDIA